MSVETIRVQEADYDLESLETLAWDMLTRGALSGRDAFHTGAMSSINPDGTPEARTMVLRQVDAAKRLLASYSDVRSPKVHTLKQHPTVGWVFYDARRRIELRAVGKTRAFTGPGDALAESVWASLPGAAQHAYSGAQPMGTRLVGRAPDMVNPTAEQVAAQATQNFGNFAVLLTFVERLEFLYLNHAGHHRARFLYSDTGAVERHWLST